MRIKWSYTNSLDKNDANNALCFYIVEKYTFVPDNSFFMRL